MELVEEPKARIKVVGVGGSGCSTVERIQSSGCGGCDFIAMNTDAKMLLESKVAAKLLLGRKVTSGLSTGNNIQMGEKAAVEEMERIKSLLSDADVVFVSAGLGGGTGAGASPVVAEAAKSQGSFVIALVNIPFSVEGKVCKANAVSAMERLKALCDMIVVVENDRVVKVTHGMSINEAFGIVNRLLLDAVTNMVDVASKTDSSSWRKFFRGLALIGSGSGATPAEAVENAFGSPLMNHEIRGASGVVLSFSVRSGEMLGDVSGSLNFVSSAVPGSQVLWFSNISRDVGMDVVEVFLLVSGLDFSI